MFFLPLPPYACHISINGFINYAKTWSQPHKSVRTMALLYAPTPSCWKGWMYFPHNIL